MMQKFDQKKRNYYRFQGKDSQTTRNKLFLVRHHDEETDQIQCDGPYSAEEKAIEILNNYLKNGTCSWLVSYNG